MSKPTKSELGKQLFKLAKIHKQAVAKVQAKADHVIKHDPIWALETQVIDMTDALKDAPSFKGIDRDALGTLHINLCVLIRYATERAQELESKYAFICADRKINTREIK
jgi:hypothetical protein